MFIRTIDGELIAAHSIVRIGKQERWPHGYFFPVAYQFGRDVIETRAAEHEVQQFLLEHYVPAPEETNT